MEIELKDFEFGIGEQEMIALLDAYKALMRRPGDEAWAVVVAGLALDHGFAHRGRLRDC